MTVRYLDHAATSPVRRSALEAMWPYLTGEFGNPSSTHDPGRRAAAALDQAHRTIGAAFGGRASEVIVTSGGTEADNLALKGVVLASARGRHLIVSTVEHEAVLESAEQLVRLHGAELTVLPVDGDGRVAPDHLAAAIRPDTALVSIQHAGNETGTVQDIRVLARIAHERGTLFHTDAVQSAGWLPAGLAELGVDALSISGHKLGAPKGVGALVVRAGVPLEPVLAGGGQERGRRSGTENVAGAVALAVAVAESEAERASGIPTRVAAARDAILDGVVAGAAATVPGIRITGSVEHRLSGTASFVLPGLSGEAVLLELERGGLVGSAGSACAAGRDEPSAVLLAMGFDEADARSAIRFTLGRDADAELGREVAARTVAAVERVAALGR